MLAGGCCCCWLVGAAAVCCRILDVESSEPCLSIEDEAKTIGGWGQITCDTRRPPTGALPVYVLHGN